MNKADVLKKVNTAFDRAGDIVSPGTIVREAADYDVSTGQATSTGTSSPCKVLFDRSQQTIQDFLAGVVIEPTDLVAWMSHVTFSPKNGDIVTVDGMAARTVVWTEDLLQLGALFLVVIR